VNDVVQVIGALADLRERAPTLAEQHLRPFEPGEASPFDAAFWRGYLAAYLMPDYLHPAFFEGVQAAMRMRHTTGTDADDAGIGRVVYHGEARVKGQGIEVMREGRVVSLGQWLKHASQRAEVKMTVVAEWQKEEVEE
jgi:hypothetical protein